MSSSNDGLPHGALLASASFGVMAIDQRPRTLGADLIKPCLVVIARAMTRANKTFGQKLDDAQKRPPPGTDETDAAACEGMEVDEVLEDAGMSSDARGVQD